MKMRKPSLSGRGWAYAGAILGGAVSIAANVAHSYVPPAGASASWTPHGGSVVGAVVWPVFLLVAVEILARVAWPEGLGWTLLRFGGLLPVAAVAALVSYRHMSGLLEFYGEDPLTTTLGPLAVDGLMVMATGALIATSRSRVAVAELVDELADEEPAPDPWSYAVPVADAAEELDSEAAPGLDKLSNPRKAQPSARDRVEKAHRRTPDATNAALAKRLGLSTKTVQRYRPEKPINGHDFALEQVSR